MVSRPAFCMAQQLQLVPGLFATSCHQCLSMVGPSTPVVHPPRLSRILVYRSQQSSGSVRICMATQCLMMSWAVPQVGQPPGHPRRLSPPRLTGPFWTSRTLSSALTSRSAALAPSTQTPHSQERRYHLASRHSIGSTCLHHRASDAAVRSQVLLAVVAVVVLFLAAAVEAGVRAAFPSAADRQVILTPVLQPAVLRLTAAREVAGGWHHRRGNRAVR